MSEDSFNPDGTVTVVEYIKHYRVLPQKIYEINQALGCLNDEELIKVMKYISRITNKRWTFRSLMPKVSKKRLMAQMKKVDSRNN